MTHTTTIANSQQLLALRRANLIRRARAQLKERIGKGDLSAAEVILDPPTEARWWALAELLVSQPGWGGATCRQSSLITASARSSRSESSHSANDTSSLRA